MEHKHFSSLENELTFFTSLIQGFFNSPPPPHLDLLLHRYTYATCCNLSMLLLKININAIFYQQYIFITDIFTYNGHFENNPVFLEELRCKSLSLVSNFSPNHFQIPLYLLFSCNSQRLLWAYFIRHQGGYGATDLMVVHVSDGWAEEDEHEAHWYRHLQHWLQQHRLMQPNKSHGRLVQEVHPACGDSE